MSTWNDDEHDLLDGLIRQLEQAWQAGGTVDLAPFVPVAGHPARHQVLLALIQTDQELRWQRGQEKTVEEYLAEWPELRDKPECVAELGESEARLRSETSARRQDPAAIPDAVRPTQAQAIHIRCPHCHQPVEILDRSLAGELTCPSCGSGFQLAEDVGTHSASGEETFAPQAPRRIAHFELLELLGQGAFGSVWKARDTKLNRIVAIKIPRRGQLLPDDVERFLREAQAPAELHHPNIVTVFEVGQDGDLAYIVSEFIEGQPLDKWLEAQGRRLTDREAAELCVTIAQALHYAHDHGVVHRDLKPSNIMLDASGQPHLLDFGLAKRLAAEITMTSEGQLLGTPAYMSPEQASLKGHLADARSDVYSLGVILFELLTGERPFRGDVRMLLRQVVEDEAPPARKLNNRISRDLETVCAKCLEKSPARRYARAADLADDLCHFLAGEPIHARPVGKPERFWRWCRRQPLAAGLVATLAASLLIGTSVSASFAIRASVWATKAVAESRRAQAKADETEAEAYLNLVAVAHQELLQGRAARAELLLESCPLRLRQWEWCYLKDRCRSLLWTYCSQSDWTKDLAFSPEGRWLGLLVPDTSVSDTSVPDMRDSGPSDSDPTGQPSLALSDVPQDASTVPAADGGTTGPKPDSGDKTDVVNFFDLKPGLWVWDISTANLVRRICTRDESFCFARDGRRVLTRDSNGTITAWDLSDGGCAGQIRDASGLTASPTGRMAATDNYDGTISLWCGLTGTLLQTVEWPESDRSSTAHSPLPRRLWFSGDGTRLAATFFDGVDMWDTTTGNSLLRLRPAEFPSRGVDGMEDLDLFGTSPYHSPAFKVCRSNTGLTRLVLADGKVVKLVEPGSTRAPITLSPPHDAAAFSSDGRCLVLSSSGAHEIWDATMTRQIAAVPEYCGDIKMSSSGQFLWLLSGRSGATLLQLASEARMRLLPEATFRAGFSPDSKAVAAVCMDGRVRLWDCATVRQLATLELGKDQSEPSPSTLPSVAQPGHLLATDQPSVVFATGLALEAAAFPAGNAPQVVLVPQSRNEVRIWSPVEGSRLATMVETPSIRCLAVSPGGDRFAAGGDPGPLYVGHLGTGKRTAIRSDLRIPPRAVAFSPDGQRVAEATGVSVRLWDARTGQMLQVIREELVGVPDALAFSPDGEAIAFGGLGGLCICRLTRTEQRVFLQGFEATAIAFSPVRKQLLCAGLAEEPKARRGTAPRISTPLPVLLNVTLNDDWTDVRFVESLGSQPSRSSAGVHDARTFLFQACERATCLVFPPDGRRLVVGDPDGLSVWEPDSGRRVLRISQASDILAVGFDARGQQLWTASRDGRIRGWSTVEASDRGSYLRPFSMTERRGRIIRPGELLHSPQQQLPEPPPAARTSQ